MVALADGLVVREVVGEQRGAALLVRETVFVREQGVPLELERDAHDAQATHFLASWQGRPVGAARLRATAAGHKLERVAVLADARGRGVGRALVEAALLRVPADAHVYLHAQERALGFWTQLGFSVGSEPFEEAGLVHRKMVRAVALCSS